MSSFPSIRIEGGLLGPDILDQLLAGDLPGQRPADFGLDSKRNLTDEIAAVFADARALWGVFQNRLARLPETDIATSVTRDAWMIPFLGLLGYEPRYNPRAHDVDGLSFAISHRAGLSSPSGRGAGGEGSAAAGAEDTPPIHIVGARQELGRVPASGRPRLAPHSLVQEYLNRTEHLWGLVTNGLVLRLLRDSTFVRRQAYVEFDLPAILEEQRFQDFAALYRLLHRTRLPRATADADACLLEQYYQQSVEQGGRVREHLRDGVEQCIILLANGFLRHPANDKLRRRVAQNPPLPLGEGRGEGATHDHITAAELYRQLLLLVYRFLFLLVSEDRGLLSSDPLYREHYSISRLRRLLDHRPAFNDHDDLWHSLRVLWLLLIKDQPQPALNNRPMAAALGLPVLNGELFAPLDLDACSISNNDLLQAFWRLAWYQDRPNQPPRRVNYAALDVEELGSVYESLLEFHPWIDFSAAPPVFSLLAGAERKSTGSYYTPPELVGQLIHSSLEPVLAERLQGAASIAEKEQAILAIRVCDPACGSGHFLLAAARRLGKELARVRTGEDEPAPERVREAIRDVVSHCIYGVDRNPLAVELCRVALWLESHTEGKPLTFLDHRIRCGDSLVGVLDLGCLDAGIPDEAFAPVAGDDKATAKGLKAQNRRERQDRDAGQLSFGFAPAESLGQLARESLQLNQIADDSPEAIRRKRQLFEQGHADPAWRRQKLACDLWTAAFFQQLKPERSPLPLGDPRISPLPLGDPSISPLPLGDPRISPLPLGEGPGVREEGLRVSGHVQGVRAVTTADLANHMAGRPIDPRVLAQAEAIAARQRFFHWPLEFPEVFLHSVPGQHRNYPSPSGRGARGEGGSDPGSPRHRLPPDLLQFARHLRQEQTDAEKLLWSLLRARQFAGFKFRRQHPLPPYVLDFYCHELRLAIELDGGQHNALESRRHDKKRSNYLAEKGIKVIRFWNHEVLQDTEAVLEAIWRETVSRGQDPSPLTPLPEGEGTSPSHLPKNVGTTTSRTPLPEGEGRSPSHLPKNVGTTTSRTPLPEGEGTSPTPLPLGEGPGVRAEHPPEAAGQKHLRVGFDVVLSNPPWERIKLAEQEFFAARDPRIAAAPNKAERAQRIKRLATENPALHAEYLAALHDADALSKFLRQSSRCPLTGRGDINTYAVFAETIGNLLAPAGRAGVIVPTGIATDATCQIFFGRLNQDGRLASLFDFENREGLFPAVDSRYKFSLLTLRGGASDQRSASAAEFAFFLTRAAQLNDPRRRFTLSAEDFALLNPNTRTCPIFRTRADAELTKAIYRRVPVLVREALTLTLSQREREMVHLPSPKGRGAGDQGPTAGDQGPTAGDEVSIAAGEGGNPWGVRFMAMFHMANDSHLFRTRDELERAGYVLRGNRFVSRPSPPTPLPQGEGGRKAPTHLPQGEGGRKAPTPLPPGEGGRKAPTPLPPGEGARGEGEGTYLPLYEAKMIWQFDHRFGSYAGVTGRSNTHLPTPGPEEYADPGYIVQPCYWVPVAEVDDRLEDCPQKWLLGFRDVTNATNERTSIFSLLPRTGVGHKAPLVFTRIGFNESPIEVFLANLNALVLDYVARQKIGGISMSFFILHQLPVLPPSAYTAADVAFIVPRVLELVYTAWDLKPFADDVWGDADAALRGAMVACWQANRLATGGGDPALPDWADVYPEITPADPAAVLSGRWQSARFCPLPPWRWDEGRRAVLRAELDAYYARLYGLSRKQLRYILDPADLTAKELEDILDPHEEVSDPLDPAGYAARCQASDFPGETFRVLKEKELRKYGEYRTRRLVLEAWERTLECGGNLDCGSLLPLFKATASRRSPKQ